jgi:hypothetical protein
MPHPFNGGRAFGIIGKRKNFRPAPNDPAYPLRRNQCFRTYLPLVAPGVPILSGVFIPDVDAEIIIIDEQFEPVDPIVINEPWESPTFGYSDLYLESWEWYQVLNFTNVYVEAWEG